MSQANIVLKLKKDEDVRQYDYIFTGDWMKGKFNVADPLPKGILYAPFMVGTPNWIKVGNENFAISEWSLAEKYLRMTLAPVATVHLRFLLERLEKGLIDGERYIHSDGTEKTSILSTIGLSMMQSDPELAQKPEYKDFPEGALKDQVIDQMDKINSKVHGFYLNSQLLHVRQWSFIIKPGDTPSTNVASKLFHDLVTTIIAERPKMKNDQRLAEFWKKNPNLTQVKHGDWLAATPEFIEFVERTQGTGSRIQDYLKADFFTAVGGYYTADVETELAADEYLHITDIGVESGKTILDVPTEIVSAMRKKYLAIA